MINIDQTDFGMVQWLGNNRSDCLRFQYWKLQKESRWSQRSYGPRFRQIQATTQWERKTNGKGNQNPHNGPNASPATGLAAITGRGWNFNAKQSNVSWFGFQRSTTDRFHSSAYLNVCFAYTSRQEMTHAVNVLDWAVKNQLIEVEWVALMWFLMN